ncbi:MAG: transcription elongation factor GreB [Sandaracinaceae bacterium]|nr:transcription elongation factor GreB [Sandaracinaceae bacterium]MDW8245782.1 transcription elongation factor GreB [Sandaracinaceae bacterium]
MRPEFEDEEEEEEQGPRGPSYITPAGRRRLELELERLGEERARVVQTTAAAAAEGDRSENAEYIYGKRRLRQIDSRMRFLRKIIEQSVVIDPSIDRGDRIYFGATVTLLDEEGNESVYAIVGEHETDAERGRISYRSPLGAALLGKQVDDEITVHTPKGVKRYTVLAVKYVDLPWPE